MLASVRLKQKKSHSPKCQSSFLSLPLSFFFFATETQFIKFYLARYLWLIILELFMFYQLL